MAHAPVESVGPVAVTSVEARSVEIPVLIEANGQIVGGHEARVASGATGRVVDVRVERGSTVSKGEVLAVIDDRLLTSTRDEARAAVAQAAANATVADDECKRAKALFDKGLSNEAARLRADAQCATARAALEAAEARLRAAEARVSDTRLKAPFAGVIGERMVSPGEYVRDDTTVATLVGNADIRLELTLGERQAMRVTGGEIVHFRVSGDDVDREAVIDRISPSLRDRGRDLVVEARISEHDLVGLRPGAFVRAGVETAAQTAVLVPVSAVARDGSATRAWVVNEGRAEERIVAVGAVQGEEIPVLDGLVPGERVISPIPGGLRDGAAVVE
ncbi:MAG: efflux RND transporter periplasmic adaptor subunit [Myxococcota bacterium]